jgi:ATP-binding cassette subfamily F protein 3
VVEGNYDTYRHLVRQRLEEESAAVAAANPRNANRSTQRNARAQPVRRRKFPYRKLADLEAEIHEREARIEELHQALASTEVLRDGERVKQAKSELDEQSKTLAHLYEHWEEAAELN